MAKLVSDATPVARELGMIPLITKLQLLSDLVQAAPSEYPGGLTEREVEVLRLIATGNSNQRIADQLFLSRYTVVRHVSNIFGKIDADNRAEATTYAHEHDLLINSPNS
jgi:DNA-binding NarL/FixJ family response regulator